MFDATREHWGYGKDPQSGINTSGNGRGASNWGYGETGSGADIEGAGYGYPVPETLPCPAGGIL